MRIEKATSTYIYRHFMQTNTEIKRRIELWHCGVSKLTLAEYLGVSEKQLKEILERLRDTDESSG